MCPCACRHKATTHYDLIPSTWLIDVAGAILRLGPCLDDWSMLTCYLGAILLAWSHQHLPQHAQNCLKRCSHVLTCVHYVPHCSAQSPSAAPCSSQAGQGTGLCKGEGQDLLLTRAAFRYTRRPASNDACDRWAGRVHGLSMSRPVRQQ